MTRKSLEHFNCSWAQAAEAIGDKWSLMIVRDAFHGVKTFSAFANNLGIAKNILIQRLEHLQHHGVIEKRPMGVGSSRFEYTLSEKGRALLPVFIALGQWGDQWVFGKGQEPLVVIDRKTKKPIKKLHVVSADNRNLKAEDVTVKAGKGANEANRRAVEEIQKQF